MPAIIRVAFFSPCRMPSRACPPDFLSDPERPHTRPSDPPSQAAADAACRAQSARTRGSFYGLGRTWPSGGPLRFGRRSRCSREQRSILGLAGVRTSARVRRGRSSLPAARPARPSGAQRGGQVPAGGSCTHTVGTGYHSLGVVCTCKTTGFHTICNMKYAEHIGHAHELFYESWHGCEVVSFSEKSEIYTVAEPWRPRGGSEWVWDCTVVIHDHNLTSQSTRDLHHEPSWSPVRLNCGVCAPLRD